MASLPATRPASRRPSTPSASSSSSTQYAIAPSSCVLVERSCGLHPLEFERAQTPGNPIASGCGCLTHTLGPATGRNA